MLPSVRRRHTGRALVASISTCKSAQRRRGGSALAASIRGRQARTAGGFALAFGEGAVSRPCAPTARAAPAPVAQRSDWIPARSRTGIGLRSQSRRVRIAHTRHTDRPQLAPAMRHRAEAHAGVHAGRERTRSHRLDCVHVAAPAAPRGRHLSNAPEAGPHSGGSVHNQHSEGPFLGTDGPAMRTSLERVPSSVMRARFGR
jgi:hypothetical protein